MLRQVMIGAAIALLLAVLAEQARAGVIATIPPGGDWQENGFSVHNGTDQPLDVTLEYDGAPNPPNSRWFLEVVVPTNASGPVYVDDSTTRDDTALFFNDPRPDNGTPPKDSWVGGTHAMTGNGQSKNVINGTKVGGY